MLKHCQSTRLLVRPAMEFLQNISGVDQEMKDCDNSLGYKNRENDKIRIFIGWILFQKAKSVFDLREDDLILVLYCNQIIIFNLQHKIVNSSNEKCKGYTWSTYQQK